MGILYMQLYMNYVQLFINIILNMQSLNDNTYNLYMIYELYILIFLRNLENYSILYNYFKYKIN